MSVLTTDQAKAALQRRGVSITQWSIANNLSPGIVLHVLNGRVKGHRGEAHRAAVLLGIKEGEIGGEVGAPKTSKLRM